MKGFFSFYRKSPMRVNLGAFALGAGIGLLLWRLDTYDAVNLTEINALLSPLGNLLLLMLKMVVVPIIFFSLACGVASLPINKFGKMGGAVLLWYFVTSLFAAIYGTSMASIFNPKMNIISDNSTLLSKAITAQSASVDAANPFVELLYSLFQNPFQALAEGSFLPIITFSILLGLAARTILDTTKNPKESQAIETMLTLFDAFQKTSFKLIDWVMLYFPIGVFALTAVNFATHGADLFSSYAQIAICVIVAVFLFAIRYLF